MARKLPVRTLNAHLTCALCSGYFVDATTLVECLHSFCRSCIVRYLTSSRGCPVCDVEVDLTSHMQGLRRDECLQALVYKLVPGLVEKEAARRSDFSTDGKQLETKYSSGGATEMNSPSASLAVDRVTAGDNSWRPARFLLPTDQVSVCLQHHVIPPSVARRRGGDGELGGAVDKRRKREEVLAAEKKNLIHCRYILCESRVTLAALKKFVLSKLQLSPCQFEACFFSGLEIMQEFYTLADMAYIQDWLQDEPLKLSYVVFRNCSLMTSSLSTETTSTTTTTETTVGDAAVNVVATAASVPLLLDNVNVKTEMVDCRSSADDNVMQIANDARDKSDTETTIDVLHLTDAVQLNHMPFSSDVTDTPDRVVIGTVTVQDESASPQPARTPPASTPQSHSAEHKQRSRHHKKKKSKKSSKKRRGSLKLRIRAVGGNDANVYCVSLADDSPEKEKRSTTSSIRSSESPAGCDIRSPANQIDKMGSVSDESVPSSPIVIKSEEECTVFSNDELPIDKVNSFEKSPNRTSTNSDSSARKSVIFASLSKENNVTPDRNTSNSIQNSPAIMGRELSISYSPAMISNSRQNSPLRDKAISGITSNKNSDPIVANCENSRPEMKKTTSRSKKIDNVVEMLRSIGRDAISQSKEINIQSPGSRTQSPDSSNMQSNLTDSGICFDLDNSVKTTSSKRELFNQRPNDTSADISINSNKYPPPFKTIVASTEPSSVVVQLDADSSMTEEDLQKDLVTSVTGGDSCLSSPVMSMDSPLSCRPKSRQHSVDDDDRLIIDIEGDNDSDMHTASDNTSPGILIIKDARNSLTISDTARTENRVDRKSITKTIAKPTTVSSRDMMNSKAEVTSSMHARLGGGDNGKNKLLSSSITQQKKKIVDVVKIKVPQSPKSTQPTFHQSSSSASRKRSSSGHDRDHYASSLCSPLIPPKYPKKPTSLSMPEPHHGFLAAPHNNAWSSPFSPHMFYPQASPWFSSPLSLQYSHLFPPTVLPPSPFLSPVSHVAALNSPGGSSAIRPPLASPEFPLDMRTTRCDSDFDKERRFS